MTNLHRPATPERYVETTRDWTSISLSLPAPVVLKPPQVRCDAASLGVPCTNCVAFSIECKIPAPKRKKGQNKAKESDR